MRVECSSCKRLAEAEFELAADATLAVTCTTCGVTTTSTLAPRRAIQATIPLEKLCPKCGAVRRPDGTACAACGLQHAQMATYAESREAQTPDELRAAWDTLVGAWGEPARHDDLLALVARHGCFAWAAGRYRDAARARPHDPIAPRQLERVRRAGEAALFATGSMRAEQGKTPYTAVFAILGVLVLAIVGGMLYAVVKHNDAPDTAATHLHTR